MAVSWDADRQLLESQGFQVRVARERPSYVEADVTRDSETLRMEWVRDSAFRFYPLVRHEEFGLALHPFDLATNKVLALVGRLEVRDWVDVIHCAEHVQPLGYLAWAASGKDPGFSPGAILDQAARSSHYSAIEVGELAFDGEKADAAALSRRWRHLLDAAQRVTAILPAEHVGTCVLSHKGDLFLGAAEDAQRALSGDLLRFHNGSIKGALPRIVGLQK